MATLADLINQPQYGNLQDATGLWSAYRNTLGRDPAEAEIAQYGGMGRAALSQMLQATPERAMYQQSAADPSRINAMNAQMPGSSYYGQHFGNDGRFAQGAQLAAFFDANGVNADSIARAAAAGHGSVDIRAALNDMGAKAGVDPNTLSPGARSFDNAVDQIWGRTQASANQSRANDNLSAMYGQLQSMSPNEIFGQGRGMFDDYNKLLGTYASKGGDTSGFGQYDRMTGQWGAYAAPAATAAPAQQSGGGVAPDWLRGNEVQQWNRGFGEQNYRLQPQGGSSSGSWGGRNTLGALVEDQGNAPGMTLGRMTGPRGRR